VKRALFAISFVFIATEGFSQTAGNVLLVLNESSPLSLDIGQYYAQKRGVPAANILRLKTTLEETIARTDYERQIEFPIAGWLARNSAQDRILYIVLTKNFPLRIAGSSGPDGTIASVDSELTLLYRRMIGQGTPPPGRIANPYFARETPPSQARRFTHEHYDMFLVTRLDGFTSAAIRSLIDRGLVPSTEGKIVLDEKESADLGNEWLRTAAERLRGMGFQDRVLLDSSGTVLTGIKGVLGYYSWGSNDPAIRMRRFDLGFVPGALAAMFVSSDGRTFSEPPGSWKPGTWDDKTSHFAGSPQSLAGDLILEGATGVAGHVAEPYLQATIRPDILFPAYLSGFNLAEAFYMAMPYVSWQTVVVGDPLCAPFRTSPLSSEQIDKGIDPATELPGYFGTRRMRMISVPAYQRARIHPDTIKLVLRAEVRIVKRDFEGARRILEEATLRDSRLVSAQTTLASLYEQAEDFDNAIQRYRRVLEVSPNNAIALNNLAYALAVRKKSPQEALPLAEKAYAAAKASPNVADTVGWIHHLLGNNDKAMEFLEEALKGHPNAEVHFHAAAVYAALGQNPKAAEELGRALQLDPDLAKRADVQQLQSRLR
jgi:uncharacterized protein (TIGR03790 family)